MLLHLLIFILDVFIMPDCFKPNSRPLSHSLYTKFHLECLNYIYRQFQAPLSRQIALDPTLGRFVTHSVPNSAFNACIISINRILAYNPADVKCYSKRGKILTVKSINNMPMHLFRTRFGFLIQNLQINSTLYLILNSSVTPGYFRPDPRQPNYLSYTRFCFECLYCIYRQDLHTLFYKNQG